MKYIFKNKFYSFLFFLIDITGTVFSLPFLMFRRRLPGNVGHILLIRMDHIGDVVCSTPLPQNLKEHYRGAKITFLVSTAARGAVINNPYIDEVICYDPPWFSRGKKRIFEFRRFFVLTRELKRHNYDLGFDLRGDFRHIILMILARVRFRVGYGITGGGFLLNHKVNYRNNVHTIERSLDCLRSMGIDIIAQEPKVYPSAKDEESAEEFIKENNISAEDFTAVIHPYAGYSSKNWLDGRFAELMRSLYAKYNARIILAGSGKDKINNDKLIDRSRVPAINAADRTSLGSLTSLISKASVFIGVDSGPSHIAALTKTPCVVLYSGTNNPWEWGPRNDKAIIIQTDIPCKGCERMNCEHNICMDLISVEDVMDAVEKVTSIT